jgi:hypothetical protein
VFSAAGSGRDLKETAMQRLFKTLITATLLATFGVAAHASSHREALAILNEPCADNTDTYAWVKPGQHDKLYLIMNFNPLHEPGQGNQGLRACNGYRYEFHIGIGASLKSKLIYRVEFKNTLTPEQAPSPSDPLGGGNELLWQLTGGSETMQVSRIVRPDGRHDDDDDDDDDRRGTVIGKDLKVLPNNHGPQTDRLVYHLGAFQGYDSGNPASRENGLYDQPFVDTFIHPLSNGGRIIAGQFDDPYQLDEKGIFDLVNLNRDDLGGIPGARRPPGEDVFTGFNIFSIALEVPIADIFPNGIPHNGVLHAASTDSLLRVHSSIARQKTQTVDASNIITGLRGSGKYVQVGRNALPLFNAGLVGTQRQTLYLRSSPLHDVTNFGADILYPVLVRDAEGTVDARCHGDNAQRAPPGHHHRHQPGPADPGRRRLDGRCHHARRRDRLELPEWPAPGRRDRAEPAPGQREHRADQLDRRGQPGRRSGQGHRGQRQGLSPQVPVPGACAPRPAARARRRQRADGAEHSAALSM